jgi:hypothetical protein
MKMEKKEYLAPRVETVIYGADLMQHEVITTSPTPAGGDQEAKKADLFFDEDEDNTAETGSLWDEPMWQ